VVAEGKIQPSRLGPSRMPASTSPITGGWPTRPTTQLTTRAAIITAAIASINRPKVCSALRGWAATQRPAFNTWLEGQCTEATASPGDARNGTTTSPITAARIFHPLAVASDEP
jgi:hypothetical protein